MKKSGIIPIIRGVLDTVPYYSFPPIQSYSHCCVYRNWNKDDQRKNFFYFLNFKFTFKFKSTFCEIRCTWQRWVINKQLKE